MCENYILYLILVCDVVIVNKSEPLKRKDSI